MHTFVNPLNRAVVVAADREALVCGDVRLTHAELHSRLRRLATVLADDLRTARGDRVAILAGNSHLYIEMYCGIPAAGRVVVPLNTRWAEAELAYALDDAGAAVLVTDRDPGGLAELVETVVRIDDGGYDGLVSAAAEGDFDPDLTEDTLAGLFYTGGTTGASKGVMLTHRNLVANTFHSQMIIPIRPDDTALVIAPLFHAAGSNSVLQCIGLGARQVVLAGAFDPAASLDLVETEGVDFMLGVPTMIAAMLEVQAANPRDVGSLRMIAHGGSPIALELVRRATQLFPGAELIHLYGATETAPLLTGLNHEEALIDGPRGKSCGQAVLGVELRIERDGEAQPVGEAGEVLARGANIMQGYWNKPEQTAAALEGGWYHTGDVGYLDDGGYLYLVDRAKDMIVTGGENVYCTEVEDAIYTHPMVLEATVFGVPDERWGEAVHAVVVPRGEVSETEIIEHCRSSIAGYKVPKSVSFRDDPLPVSGPGKVLKRELRAPFWEGHERQIN